MRLSYSFRELMAKRRIEKFNPYHGPDGRFTTGSGATSFTIRTKDPSKQGMVADAVVKEVEKGIRNGRDESAVCVDSEGKVLFQKGGDSSSVKFTASECSLMDGCTLTHNHPNNGALSPEDILCFVGNSCERVRAVGPEGSLYEISRGDDYSTSHGYTFVQEYASAFEDAHKFAQKDLNARGYAERVRSGEVSYDEANAEYKRVANEYMDNFAKEHASAFGIIYRSELGEGYKNIPNTASVGKSGKQNDFELDGESNRKLDQSFNEWLKSVLKVEKFNPYHDALGRFTTGSGATSFTIRTKDSGKQGAVGRAVANEAADQIRSLDHEESFIVGPDGHMRHYNVGEEGHVTSTIGEMREHAPGAVVMHNHPHGGTFSPDDLHTLGYGPSEMRAVTRDGDYVMRSMQGDQTPHWPGLRDAVEAAAEHEFLEPYQLRNKIFEEKYRPSYDAEVNSIADRWIKQKESGASKETLDATFKEWQDAEAAWLKKHPKEDREKEANEAYANQYHEFYREHAAEYGIEYEFIPKVKKYNHNHDEKGRFASGSGGSDLKARQFEIIQRTNPAPNDYQTWVRSTSDILTLGEALKQGVVDGECDEGDDFTPDFSWSDAEAAIQSGKITVYSSHDIESGAWVTPSKMEAESYGGANSKEVPIEDIAWVDPLQGMYAPVGVKKYNHNHDPHTGRFTTGNGSSSSDAAYMEAAKRGDTKTCRKMLEEKARALASDGIYAKETSTYKLREGAEPQKTIKVYKTFYVDENGNPSTLFVEGTSPLPVGVWMDAKDAYHFTNPENGKEYTPSRRNPNAEKKGKTGSSIPIPNEEVRQELKDRGFISEDSEAKNVTALAYRPGWHAGDLPFFPQGGKQDPVYAADEKAYTQLWKDISAEEHVGETKAKRLREERYGTFEQWRDPLSALEHPYKHIHEARQVVFECEMMADHDYTRTEPVKDDPTKVNFLDMQEMPKDGSYMYATNPMAKAHGMGAWYISGSMRIVRPMSQQECDVMLLQNGARPQAWSTGEMSLKKLGVKRENSLEPIVYDDNGNIIPLSERFKKPVKKSLTPTGCGVIVVNERGEVLIGTRKENASKGQICGPGGHIEHGETAEEAAIREAREEFNIECRNLKRLGTQNGGRHGVSAVFLCTDYSGTPRTDEEEMTNCRWADPEDLEEDLFPPFERSLELLRVKKFNRNHDPKTGRFTSGVSGKLTVVTSGGYKDYKGSPFGDATTGEEDVPKIDRDKPKEDARRMFEGDEIVRYGGKPTRGHVKLDENWHDLNDFERFELAKNQISEELGCSQEDAQRYANSVKSFTGQGGAFVEIRAYQRGELDGVRAKMIGPTAKALDEYIENAPQWDGGSIYRGISSDERHFYAGLEKGDVIDMGGASSWTSERSVADEYSGSDGEIFVVDKPTKGTSVSHLSHYPHEGEVAVSSTVSYRVTSVEYDENGVKITHLVQCKLPVTKSKSFFGVLMDKIAKYNHNHDPATGRFTSGSVLGTSGGSGSGGQSGQSGQSKACLLIDVEKGEPMDHNKADSGNVNPNFDPNSTVLDYRTNCYLCVLAYEARRRGYNVEAEANMGLLPTLSQSQTNAWKNPDGSPVKIDYTVDIEANDANPADTCYNNLMINMKSEGRYHFSFAWDDGRGAHVVCLSKPNGVMEIYDPQSDETIRGMNDCKEYLKRIKYPVGNTRLRKPSIVRVDNKEFSVGNVMAESYIFREKQV